MDTSEKLYIVLMLSFAFSMAFSITIGYLYMLGQIIESYIPELYGVYHSYTMLGGLIGSSSILITAGVYQLSQSADKFTEVYKELEPIKESDCDEELVTCENCGGCVRPEEPAPDSTNNSTHKDYMYL